MLQVNFEHDHWYREDGPWDLDVKHTYPRCSESKKIAIMATLTGKK
jgi:hypothetical protein